jgi:hypothetical protein
MDKKPDWLELASERLERAAKKSGMFGAHQYEQALLHARIQQKNRNERK